MQTVLAITKALSDEARVRALLALRGGELCLCQVIELLELAPSTVSKHMSLLFDAGLVERRKEGRWHYYRLAGRDASPEAKAALKWVLASLENEPYIERDAQKVCCIRKRTVEESAACCYSAGS